MNFDKLPTVAEIVSAIGHDKECLYDDQDIACRDHLIDDEFRLVFDERCVKCVLEKRLADGTLR